MAGEFVGHKDDLDKLKKLLKGPSRYITIHGFGGIGKTALALQAARNYDSNRVLALSLVKTPEIDKIFKKIARYLKVDILDLDNQQDKVLQALEGKDQILLCFDNMEDVKYMINSSDPLKQEKAKL